VVDGTPGEPISFVEQKRFKFVEHGVGRAQQARAERST
jgi:hypothetical protein